MTDHENPEDRALQRLRAADPGRGSSVDLAGLRAAVDARIAAEEGSDGVAPVIDLTRAPSRRGRWLRVAAVAASAVVIGTVGFGLGRGSLAPQSGVDAAGDSQEVASAEAMDEEAMDEAAAGSGLGSEAAMDSRMMYPGTSERTTFHAEGLPNDAGTATTWAFDATVAFTAARVGEIAAILGVQGEPELVDGSWQVGSTDGTGAYLFVYPDGQASLNFYDPEADPWGCQAMREGTASRCPDLGDAPGDDEARQLTSDLLASIGLDPAGFEYEVSKDEGAGWISVAANQLLDGQRTGVAWWASYTGAGLQSLSGSLATLTELGDYPVVGAEEAVSRITDPRFGTLGGWSILAAEGARDTELLGGDAAVEAEVLPAEPEPAPTEPPTPPSPGSPVPWPVEDVAITVAELGVAQYTTADGAALLVPAWELTAEDGRTWTVLALAEDALDLEPLED